MIVRLKGPILEADSGKVVIDAGGVGYEVWVPETILLQLPPIGEIAELHVRQVFREDSMQLFGFADGFQRRMFDIVTEVKGCGPKIGLALIGQIGEHSLATAIATQDSQALCKASGVGPRLAERIVVELRDKVQQETMLHKTSQQRAAARLPDARIQDELVEALIALGYRRLEAEAAATDARDASDSVEEQLKFALRSLHR